LILLAVVLIGLALTIAAVAYQRVVIKRFQTASKATQEHFETIAADLRNRALDVKKQDEGLRKRDLEVKERDELKGFVKDAEAQRPQQQRQVLKGSQRALKESVSHIITVGLKDISNPMRRVKKSESDQEPGRQAHGATTECDYIINFSLSSSTRQLSVLMLCSLTTGPQSFIWSARNLRCTSGPPICIVICIASMRLLIAGSRSVSANALLKRSTMARGVRPAVNEPHQA
jgi:hypothetical protein